MTPEEIVLDLIKEKDFNKIVTVRNLLTVYIQGEQVKYFPKPVEGQPLVAPRGLENTQR